MYMLFYVPFQSPYFLGTRWEVGAAFRGGLYSRGGVRIELGFDRRARSTKNCGFVGEISGLVDVLFQIVLIS